MPAEDLLRSPCGDTFVRARRAKGILPEILEELLGARKRAKADLKAATDPFRKAVLDGRQLALKARLSSSKRCESCKVRQGSGGGMICDSKKYHLGNHSYTARFSAVGRA